jgi:hypothetical protein
MITATGAPTATFSVSAVLALLLCGAFSASERFSVSGSWIVRMPETNEFKEFQRQKFLVKLAL